MTKRHVKVAINIAAHIIGTLAMTIASIFAIIVIAFICDGGRMEVIEAMIMAGSVLISVASVIAMIAVHKVKKTFYKLVDKSNNLVDLD